MVIKKFDDFADLEEWARAKSKRFTFIIDKQCDGCRRNFIDIKAEVVKQFPDWEFCQIYTHDWCATQRLSEMLHPDNQSGGFYRIGLTATKKDQVQFTVDFIKNCK